MTQNRYYWGYPILRQAIILVIRDISHFVKLYKLKNINWAIAGFEWKCIYCYNLNYKTVVYPRRFSSDSFLVVTISHDSIWKHRYTQVLITFSRAPRFEKLLGRDRKPTINMLQNNTRITTFIIARSMWKSGITSTILEICLYLQDNNTLQY